MREVLLDGATIIERVTSFFGAEEWLSTLEIVLNLWNLKLVKSLYVLHMCLGKKLDIGGTRWRLGETLGNDVDRLRLKVQQEVLKFCGLKC